MCITRTILNKTEDKFIEIYGSKPKDLAKAFVLGMVDGFIDSAVIIGTIVIVKGWINIITKKN